MQKTSKIVSGMFCAIATVATVDSAFAESPQQMMADCRSRGAQALKTRMPNVETKYEGQRTDGTHAVNGTARIRQNVTTFQCSFNPAGSRIVNFIVNKPPLGATQLPEPPKPSAEPETRTTRLRFRPGVTATSVGNSLKPGASIRYLVKGKNLQDLLVQLTSNSASNHFNIFTPSGSKLYESVKAGKSYRGQLYQNGDHVIEVYNLGQNRTSHRLYVTLKRN
jgi:hypothetical protein